MQLLRMTKNMLSDSSFLSEINNLILSKLGNMAQNVYINYYNLASFLLGWSGGF